MLLIGLLIGLAFWWIPIMVGFSMGYCCRVEEEKKGIKPYEYEEKIK